MKRKRLLRALFATGVILAGLVAVLRSAWMGKKVCAQARTRLPGLTGLQVTIQSCQLEPLELGAELKGVALENPGVDRDAFEADRVEVQLRLLPALWGAVRLARVELDRPRVNLDLSHLEERGRPRDANACLADKLLERIDVGWFSLARGEAHLVLPGGRSLDLANVSVAARTHRGATALRISQESGKLTLPGVQLPLDRVVVSGQIDAVNRTATISRAELVAGEVSLLGHGTVRDLCDPQLSLEANAAAPLDLFAALTGPRVAAKGYVTANASVAGKLVSPAVHAELDLSDLALRIDGQDLEPKDLSASVDLRGDEIELRQLYWPIGDGFARISGEVTRAGNWPIALSVEGKGIPVGELMNRLPLKHPWIDAVSGVKAHLTGHLLPTPVLQGPTSVDIADFVVRTHAWDGPPAKDDQVLRVEQAHLDTQFDFTPERVKLTQTRLATGRSALTAEATLWTDPDRGMEIAGDLEPIDLSELGPLAGLFWSGVGSATAHIAGPYGDPTIDGTVSLRDFKIATVNPGEVSGQVHFHGLVLDFKDVVAFKGKTTYRGEGALDFSRESVQGGGWVRVDGGRVQDLLDVVYPVHWGFALVRGDMTGRISGRIDLAKGPVMAPTSDFDLHFRDAVLWGRPLGDADFRMHTEDGSTLEIPPFHFRGGAGELSFGGRQEVGGPVDYTLEVKDLPVPVATSPELADWKMTGTLSGRAHMTGLSSEPAIRGEILGKDLTLEGIPLGQGDVKIEGLGSSMAFTGPLGDDVTLWMRMRWENGLPFESRLTFDIDDLSSHLPTREEWSDVSGQLRGVMTCKGDFKDSSTFAGSYRFGKAVFTKGDYSAQAEEPVVLDFRGRRYALESFSIEGTNTHLSLTGTWGADDALNGVIKGDLDVRLLESFFPSIESSGGRLEVAAQVTGTRSGPAVVGSAILSHGRLKWRDDPIQIEGLDGRVEFSQASVEIPGLTGTLNRGRMLLTGNIALQRFSPRAYDLHLALDESQIPLSETLPATLSGGLNLIGSAGDPVLSGSISVVRLRYAEDLKLERLIQNLTRKRLEAKTFNKSPKVVRFANLGIHLDGDVRVDNNLLKTQLKGDLSLLGDNAHPVLRGEIEGQDGGRAFFRGNELQLDQLLVTFKDTEKIIPDFDVHATTQVRDYKVFLHAYGTPDDPAVHLTSQPELAESDLITLLTLGFTSLDRGNNGVAGGAGVAAEALYSLTGLDQQVQRFIPKNAILRDPSFRLTTTYSQALGSMVPTAELEGKVLTDRLKLRVQQPVSSSRGSRIQGELRLNDFSSVQGQWTNDNYDYNFGDLGLDMKLRWELK